MLVINMLKEYKYEEHNYASQDRFAISCLNSESFQKLKHNTKDLVTSTSWLKGRFAKELERMNVPNFI